MPTVPDPDSNPPHPAARARAVARRILFSTAALWIVLVVAAAGLTVRQEEKRALDLAWENAREHVDFSIAFRRWASRHGGVYVPTDSRTPPNPYLTEVAERDIATPSGRRLTLMNPAYMLRQFGDESADLKGHRARITSLQPLNPMNAPDPWERAALERLARGESEVEEVDGSNGDSVVRVMRPFFVDSTCLKCHNTQGYRVGDLRGGIDAAVPLTPYLDILDRAVPVILTAYALLLAFGLILMALAWRWAEAFLREQEALERDLIHAERLSAVGRLAAGVTHEFNNALAVIRAHAQALSLRPDAGGGALPSDVRDALGVIEAQCGRAGRIVEGMLSFARPTPPVRAPCWVEDVVDETFRLLEPRITAAGVRLERRYARAARADVDRAQIAQVLMNLALNALDALRSKRGGRISVAVDAEPPYVVVRFSDDGVGMYEETRLSLFTPFFTTKGGRSEEEAPPPGVGLGLVVSLRIVQAHGGRIDVESRPGEGSTFTLRLPSARKA